VSRPIWRLADYYEPVGANEGFPEYLVSSEADLSHRLAELAKGKPRIVELYSPTEEFLRMGIGGAFAGLAVIKRTNIRILVSPGSTAPGPISFESQGQPSTLQPDELHDPGYVITLACRYFAESRLPDGLIWRS
jgi:hypothetical protein